MYDYTDHLLHYLPQDRIDVLSCGHVIPSSSLLALPIGKGPNGVDFEFSFGKRNSDSMVIDSCLAMKIHTDCTQLRELGLTILDLAMKIPDGFVVFFPSYAYLDTAVQSWTKNRIDGKPIIDHLTSKKRIFSEPRSAASRPAQAADTSQDQPKARNVTSVDQVLAAYTTQVNTGEGALLLAVIGGSLSEGINFSDRLGRGVAVVGLPFPNPHSPEWKAKLEYVARNARSSGRDAAQEFLENACMRAVNQSIGRAIRHQRDYATIVLLDARYERASIRAKLPGWIKDSVVRRDYRGGIKSVEQFFAGKV